MRPRIAWNQGAARYAAELEGTIAFIRGGGSNLHPIERLGEYPDDYWESFPNLRPELRGRIPMTFSILARRPLIPQ